MLGSGVQEIIKSKLASIYSQSQHQNFKAFNSEQALCLLIQHYESQIRFLQSELEMSTQQSAEIKVSEYLLQKLIESQPKSCLKQERQLVQSPELKQKLEHLKKENAQLDELRKQEETRIKSLQKNHENEINKLSSEFLKKLEETLEKERVMQVNNRKEIKEQLIEQLELSKKKLNFVIDEVNEALGITIIGAQDGQIQNWIKKFKKQVENYKREVKVFVNQKLKKKSTLREFAELEKQKIEARRIYLLKTVNKNK